MILIFVNTFYITKNNSTERHQKQQQQSYSVTQKNFEIFFGDFRGSGLN